MVTLARGTGGDSFFQTEKSKYQRVSEQSKQKSKQTPCSCSNRGGGSRAADGHAGKGNGWRKLRPGEEERVQDEIGAASTANWRCGRAGRAPYAG